MTNDTISPKSRKRPRLSFELPGSHSRKQAGESKTETAEDLARAENLRNPATRNEALNELLQLSATHEVNYAMSGDCILKELADICIYDCLGWDGKGKDGKEIEDDDEDSEDDDDNDHNNTDEGDKKKSKTPPIFRSKQAWQNHPTTRIERWTAHCKAVLRDRRGGGSITTSFDGGKTLIVTKGDTQVEEKIKTLEVILVILRNLSFVGGNLRLLAYSPDIICILTACMYEEYSSEKDMMLTYGDRCSNNAADSSNHTSTLALTSIQTLLHLARYLDVTGQLLLCDKLFYNDVYVDRSSGTCPAVPDPFSFGRCVSGSLGFGAMWLARKLDTKEDTMSNVTQEVLLSLTADYLVAVWSIFPAVAHVLESTLTPRPVILAALDFLQELINQARVGVVGDVKEEPDIDETDIEAIYAAPADDMPTIRAVLVNMPDSLLTRLTELLYVPRLGPDSLEYFDPIHNIVTRVTAMKLLMGYDATVDTDARDRVLDVLVPLLELDSPRMASRIGTELESKTLSWTKGRPVRRVMRTRLYEALVPILTTTVGRNEASMLASQLFRELSKAEENRTGLLYVQERLVELASRDPRVSNLVWNHLYTIPDEEEEATDYDEENVTDEHG